MSAITVKKSAQALCDEWNNANPVGAAVWLEKDDMCLTETTTRTRAYVCESGCPVIFLEGVRGYYQLSRVTPRTSVSCLGAQE
jgi:hypothetical protein